MNCLLMNSSYSFFLFLFGDGGDDMRGIGGWWRRAAKMMVPLREELLVLCHVYVANSVRSS